MCVYKMSGLCTWCKSKIFLNSQSPNHSYFIPMKLSPQNFDSIQTVRHQVVLLWHPIPFCIDSSASFWNWQPGILLFGFLYFISQIGFLRVGLIFLFLDSPVYPAWVIRPRTHHSGWALEIASLDCVWFMWGAGWFSSLLCLLLPVGQGRLRSST